MRRLNLSPREQELVQLLVGGCSIRTAASRVGISPNTAKTHMKRVHRKLGVSSRAQLVRLVVTASISET